MLLFHYMEMISAEGDKRRGAGRVGMFLVGAIALVGSISFIQAVFAANIPTQVIVDNATPSVTVDALNQGNSITLTANATTSITVSFTISDNNGCTDVFTNGNVTTTVYRSGFSGGGFCTTDNNSCYRVSTSTHACSAGNTANATATVDIYYFADATDSSSSFAAQDWVAHVWARDAAIASSSATSTHRELNTLTAINVTTSSINYGTVTASSTTGSVNGVTTSTNAGNSTTTLQLRASATLTSGASSIATSSQRYATSTFTFTGGATQLTQTAATVTGYMLTKPTSTVNVQKATFWGLEVPAGTATGTYSGTNVFTELFQP